MGSYFIVFDADFNVLGAMVKYVDRQFNRFRQPLETAPPLEKFYDCTVISNTPHNPKVIAQLVTMNPDAIGVFDCDGHSITNAAALASAQKALKIEDASHLFAPNSVKKMMGVPRAVRLVLSPLVPEGMATNGITLGNGRAATAFAVLTDSYDILAIVIKLGKRKGFRNCPWTIVQAPPDPLTDM